VANYSYQNATSDGTMAFIDISIDYLDRSEIVVLFDGVLTVEDTDWAWFGTTDKRITFPVDVPDGVVVTVKRITDASAIRHEFSTGAAFTARSLDEDLKQALHIAQEASEGNVSGEFFQDVDMHGFRLYNVGTAVDDTDALTLGQYKADADGAYQAKLDAEADADGAYQAKLDAEAAAASANTPSLPDAGTLTGAELLRVHQLGAFVKTTLTGLANWLIKTGTWFLQVGTGATARSVQDKLQDVVSVRDFGAHPSATRATNMAAFSAALAAAYAVTVPAGTYELDDTLVVPDNRRLSGAGKYATTLKFYPGSDKDGVVIGWYTTLEHMTLRSEAPAGGMKGTLRLQSLTHPDIPTNVGGNNWTDPAIGGLSYKNTLRELVVEYGQNYSIFGANLAYTVIDNVRAILARGSAGNLYVWGKGGVNMPSSTTVRVTGGEFTASYAGPGIAFENSGECALNGVVSEGNYGRGILLTNCDLITISGSTYVENNFAAYLGAGVGDGDIVVVNSRKIALMGVFVLGNHSTNAVAGYANENCTLVGCGLFALGGTPHPTALDAGWVQSDTGIAIVGSGTHGAGHWVKYADGTAVYTTVVAFSGAVTAADGPLFTSGTQTFTDFPAIFLGDAIAGYQFTPSLYVASTRAVWATATGTVLNNAVRYSLCCATTQAAVAADVHITLNGRWK